MNENPHKPFQTQLESNQSQVVGVNRDLSSVRKTEFSEQEMDKLKNENKKTGWLKRVLRKLAPSPRIADLQSPKRATSSSEQYSLEANSKITDQPVRMEFGEDVIAHRKKLAFLRMRRAEAEIAADKASAAASAAAMQLQPIKTGDIMDRRIGGVPELDQNTVIGFINTRRSEVSEEGPQTVAAPLGELPSNDEGPSNTAERTNEEKEEEERMRAVLREIHEAEREAQGIAHDGTDSVPPHGINPNFVSNKNNTEDIPTPKTIDIDNLNTWENLENMEKVQGQEAQGVVDHPASNEGSPSEKNSNEPPIGKVLEEASRSPEKKIGRFRKWLTDARTNLRTLGRIGVTIPASQAGQYQGDPSKMAEGIVINEADIDVFGDGKRRTLTPEEMHTRKIAEAKELDMALAHDRASIPGSVTDFVDGMYHTKNPEDTEEFFLETTKNNSAVEKPLDIDLTHERLFEDDMEETIPLSKQISPQNAGDARFVPLEIKEKAKNAREKIKTMIPNMLEKYDKLPLKGKLAISGALIGAGIVATATGSTALAFGAWFGGVALRGTGSYLAGRSMERVMRARALKKAPLGQELTKKQEAKLKWINAGTAISMFLAGTWAEYALHGLPEFLRTDTVPAVTPNVIPDVVPSNAPAPVASAPLPAASDIISQAPTPSIDVQVPSTAPSAGSVISQVAPHTNFVGIHEVIVRSGDTLTKVLLHDGIYEMFAPEDVAKLSWQGKQNLLANVVNNLNPEQLREIGITSGKANLLALGDKIDVMKLAKIAKEITINVAGEKVPLLKRALELS